MKTLGFSIAGLFVISSWLFASTISAAEPAQVAADHEGMAAAYEKKAAAQDELIAEHTEMKQDYKNRFFINEKVSPMAQIQKMETHCDAIIAGAQSLKAEFLDFAKWHRMRAAELKGQ